MIRAIRMLAAFVLCVPAAGQSLGTTLSTQPSPPIAGVPVSIILFNACGCPDYSASPAVRNGFTIDVEYFELCLLICVPKTAKYDLGVLPPGTYTVRHHQIGLTNHQVIGTFRVEAPPVPSVDARGSMVLAVALVLTAFVVLRRVSG